MSKGILVKPIIPNINRDGSMLGMIAIIDKLTDLNTNKNITKIIKNTVAIERI